MDKTTNYNFPYPENVDNINIAGDIEALAKEVDKILGNVQTGLTTEITNEINNRAVADNKLQQDITNEVAARQLLAKKVDFKSAGNKLVVIGDSVSAGHGLSDATKAWPYIIADILGMELHLYAAGGSGYVMYTSGTTFDVYAQTAVNELASVADEVGLVIILGGWNDPNSQISNWTSALSTSIKQTYTTLLNGFPNAQVYAGFFTGNMGCSGKDDSYQAKMYTVHGWIETAIQKLNYSSGINRMHMLQNGKEWLWGRDSGYMLDAIHPNETGNQELAEIIAYEICTGKPWYVIRSSTLDPSNTSWMSEGAIRFGLDHGTGFCYGAFTLNVAAGYDIIYCPTWFKHGNRQHTFTVFDGNGNHWEMYYSPIDNHIHLTGDISGIVAGTKLYLPMITFPIGF